MNHLSLFSGIGGFDLAAEAIGWNNVAMCEINKFCQKVLKKNFPNTIIHEDITKTDFTKYRGTIDIITGGFPCQPFSVAGKRKGTEDPRNLWPEMLRAIREVQPVYIVGENVNGIINWKRGLVFEQVQTDLENQGYEIQPVLLSACSVNAPHKRERVWFIAYSDLHRCNRIKKSEKRQQRETRSNFNPCNIQRNITNPNMFNDDNSRLYTSNVSQFKTSGIFQNNNKIFKKDGEKINWQRFATQSPICGRNDGISDRVDRIKALGNAIVPQVALQIFKAIDIHNNTYHANKTRK